MTNLLTISTIQKRIAVGVMAIAMLFGMFSFTPRAEASTQAELQAMIAALMTQIAELQAQIPSSNGSSHGNGGSQSSVCPYIWTRTLSIGDTGADVKKLQQFLNQSADTRVAVWGNGALGRESEYYGTRLARAVSKFQAKYRADVLSPLGLVNANNKFDASTMAKANALCSGGVEEEEDRDAIAQLVIKESSDNPDATTFQVEADDESNQYTVLTLEIVEKGDVDVNIEDIVFDADLHNTNADIGDVIDEAVLHYDGEELGDAQFSSGGLMTFENVELQIDGSESAELEILMTFESADDNYESGTQIDVSFVRIDAAEDENGNDEGDISITGSVNGEKHTLITGGAVFEKVDVDVRTNGNDSEATFEFEFEVTAVEDDVYIPVRAGDENTGAGFFFKVTEGTQSGSLVFDVDTTADEDNGEYVIEEGDTETFTVTIGFAPTYTGLYGMKMYALRYRSDGDTATLSVDDFESDKVVLQSDRSEDSANEDEEEKEDMEVTWKGIKDGERITDRYLRVQAEFEGIENIRSVTFKIDGKRVNTEHRAPWSLRGDNGRTAYPYYVSRLADGEHDLTVVVDGTPDFTKTISFFVDEEEETKESGRSIACPAYYPICPAGTKVKDAQTNPNACPIYQCVAASNGVVDDKFSGVGLTWEGIEDGDTVSGDIQVLAIPKNFKWVQIVTFYLDGKKERDEMYAPYSLGGDALLSKRIHSYQTTRLSDGKHTLKAVVKGDVEFEDTITFTVKNGSVRGASISLDPVAQLGSAIDAFEMALRAYLR